MSTAALQNVFNGLLAYNLSAADKRWLANRLTQQADEEDLRPYTMDEINAMLDRAEANIAAGNVIPHEEVMREIEEELAADELKCEAV